MTVFDVLAGLGIIAGVTGVLVPLMPGTLLVAGSILFWAAFTGGSGAWVVFAIAGAVLALGTVVKYAVPGKRLADSGVPTVTLACGAVLGVVGFFVVPVVGLPLGFVLGVYLAEWQRTTHAEAWPATLAALKAVGLGILIELGSCLVAAGVWVVGLIVV